jgi:hypothetical protein
MQSIDRAGLGRAALRGGTALAQTTVASLDAAPNGYRVLLLNSKAIYMKTEEDRRRDLLDRRGPTGPINNLLLDPADLSLSATQMLNVEFV